MIIGQSITVDGETWYPVRDPEGTEGFIVAQFLAVPSSSASIADRSAPPDQPEFAVGQILNVGDTSINLRSAPSYQETIVYYLDPGTELRITGAPVAGDEGVLWYPAVELESGTPGFAVGNRLRPLESSQTSPTPVPNSVRISFVHNVDSPRPYRRTTSHSARI